MGIGGNSLQELLDNFKTVIRRVADYNVILSAGKTKFGMRGAPYFGYIIGNGCYRVNPERQAAISQIAFPENKKATHSFLGMCLPQNSSHTLVPNKELAEPNIVRQDNSILALHDRQRYFL